MNAMLWICYTLSGAAALALEMLWMRSAALVLGATAATTATVLACYFAGLGLGSAAAARRAARPVRRYARLELAAAAAALWSLLAFRGLATDAGQRWLASFDSLGGLGVAGIVAIAAAVLPATLCLGATLPTIGQVLAPRGTLRWRGALLYALNTLGGALGVVAAGFGLPAAIGVAASYGAAIAVSVAAGLLALTADAGRSLSAAAEIARAPETAHAAPASYESPPLGHRGLCLVAAASGALGLGLEVLWTRFFAQVLHNSVYSFSAIALVFVAALALGAATAAALLRRFAPVPVAATALAAAALATLGGFWLFVHATDGLAYVGMHTGLGEYVGRIVLLAAATAGPAAFASGIVLPALWAAWGDAAGAERPLGALGAANTLGGIVGALGIGFVVTPAIGMRAGLLLAALAYLVAAHAVAGSRARLRPFLMGAVLLVPLVDPLRAPIVHLRGDAEVARAILEGPTGIVSVVDADGDLQLRLDNYYVLGGTAAAANERRLGLVPLLLHPNPRTVAFIGLATGITASAAPALEVPDTRIVELVPEVAVAARTYFAAANGSVLEQPSVRLVLDDGRRYLQSTSDRFDVVVSDLFIPWHAGTSSLYAREMYETVARRLAPGGLFCQWLPLYQLTREELDVIVHTFLAVFPDAQLWRADFYPDRPVVGLVGRGAPATVDLDLVRTRLERTPEWSRDPFLASPLGLAMLYAGDLRVAAEDFAAAPLNTDDRPRIEFLAPRLTRVNAAGDKDWFTGEALASFYDTLATRSAAAEPFDPGSEAVSAARRAGPVLYRYALAATRHDAHAAALADEVRRLAPDVVMAAEPAGSADGLADARRNLAGLRDQQETVRRQLEDMERRLRMITGREER